MSLDRGSIGSSPSYDFALVQLFLILLVHKVLRWSLEVGRGLGLGLGLDKYCFLISNSLSLIPHNIFDMMMIISDSFNEYLDVTFYSLWWLDSGIENTYPWKCLEFEHWCYEYLSWKVIKRKYSSSSEYIPHHNHTLWHSVVNVCIADGKSLKRILLFHFWTIMVKSLCTK